MKHKVILEFDQPLYAALIAAWASVVPSGYEKRLPFCEFLRMCVQTGSITLVKFAMEERNKK